jgi:hypothetical protein
MFTIFRDLTSCSLVDLYGLFGITCSANRRTLAAGTGSQRSILPGTSFKKFVFYVDRECVIYTLIMGVRCTVNQNAGSHPKESSFLTQNSLEYIKLATSKVNIKLDSWGRLLNKIKT